MSGNEGRENGGEKKQNNKFAQNQQFSLQLANRFRKLHADTGGRMFAGSIAAHQPERIPSSFTSRKGARVPEARAVLLGLAATFRTTNNCLRFFGSGFNRFTAWKRCTDENVLTDMRCIVLMCVHVPLRQCLYLKSGLQGDAPYLPQQLTFTG